MITDKDVNINHQKSPNCTQFSAGALALIVLAGVMGMTNPPREEYLHFASEKLAADLKTSVCNESQMREYLGKFGGALVGACQNLVTSQRDTIERFLDNSTHRQNLILFSIYTTEIGGKTYRSIGALGNFLPFSDK